MGIITGHTIDGRTANGKFENESKVVFTLVGAGDTLYIKGHMTKNKDSIIAYYGVEEDDPKWAFSLFRKEVQVLMKWSGHYNNDEQKIVLDFKDFTCPAEGGVITGHTTDGKTANGSIDGYRKLFFNLVDINGIKLYFKGEMNKQKNKILGSYGPEEGDLDGNFEMKLEEVKPPTPVTPVTPINPSVTIVTNLLKNNHLG